MTDIQKRCLTALCAWIIRWNLTDKQAAVRLSVYRRVTAEQVGKMREGKICPTVETFKSWALEINSSPGEKRKGTSVLDEIFKDFFN